MFGVPVFDVSDSSCAKRDKMLSLRCDIDSVENSDLLVSNLLRSVALNSRSAPIAFGKGRGLVSGSNAKPHRQKGTGRARQGSRRANHFRGGGLCFGMPRMHKKFDLSISRSDVESVFLITLLKHLDNKSVFSFNVGGTAHSVIRKSVLDVLKESGASGDATSLLHSSLSDRVLCVYKDQSLKKALRNVSGFRFHDVESNSFPIASLLYSTCVVLDVSCMEDLSNKWGISYD